MRICGVYKITNQINERVYVGGSIHVRDRDSWHRSHLKSGTAHNAAMQEDYKIYGASSFKFEIIEECSTDELEEREQANLDYYRMLPGGVYNREGPVRTPFLGAKHTPETRAHLSLAQKGRLITEATRAKMSVIQKARIRKSRKLDRIDLSSGIVVQEYKNIKEAIADGYERTSIMLTCRGKRCKHRGFGWAYVY